MKDTTLWSNSTIILGVFARSCLIQLRFTAGNSRCYCLEKQELLPGKAGKAKLIALPPGEALLTAWKSMNWLLPHLILRFRVRVNELIINVKENLFNLIVVGFKLLGVVESICHNVVRY